MRAEDIQILKELSDLHETGVLSEEEFIAAKQRILTREDNRGEPDGWSTEDNGSDAAEARFFDGGTGEVAQRPSSSDSSWDPFSEGAATAAFSLDEQDLDIPESSGMRFKDYFWCFVYTILITAGVLAAGAIILFFCGAEGFIDDDYIVHWGVATILIGFFAMPFARNWVAEETTCECCGKAFVLSNTHQEDIEHWTEYHREKTSDNGVSRYRDVPYNCRRYWQYQQCDSCGDVTRYQSESRSRA